MSVSQSNFAGLFTWASIDIQASPGVLIRTGPGVLCGWTITNNAAAARFIVFYDKATAPASTDTTLVVLKIQIDPGVASTVIVPGIGGPGLVTGISPAPNGRFLNGIGIRGCTGVALNDNTAPSTNDLVGAVFYR